MYNEKCSKGQTKMGGTAIEQAFQERELSIKCKNQKQNAPLLYN
jgi:hypothetical protein